MINLVANCKVQSFENSLRCPKKVQYFFALLEVIFVVGAILALAKVGGYANVDHRIGVWAICGVLVIVDIVMTLLLRKALLPLHEKRTKLLNAGVKIQNGDTLINLKALFPDTKRKHEYTIYSSNQVDANKSKIKKDEFFFHFITDGVADLSNVALTYYDGVRVNTIEDWCVDHLYNRFERGEWKPLGRDEGLQAIIQLSNDNRLSLLNSSSTTWFRIKEKGDAFSARKTLREDQCFFFWEIVGDHSLSNISCMTKDHIYPEWSDDSTFRSQIKTGQMKPTS